MASTATKVDETIAPVTISITGSDNYTAEHEWIINAAGYHFHNWYGFGRIDIDNATKMARNWNQNLGQFRTCSFKTSSPNLKIPANATGIKDNITISDQLSIEAVQVLVNVQHPYPGDLGFELTSPSGTKSILLNANNGITNNSSALNGLGLDNMSLISNAFYHENSNYGTGSWSLKVVDGSSDVNAGRSASLDNGTLVTWHLRVYGSGTCN